MRVNNFSVIVPEGTERSNDVVEIGHGRVYSVRLINADNAHPADATVTVDGRPMGAFRVAPHGGSITLEGPPGDGARFTAFRVDSAEGEAAQLTEVPVTDRGLIVVTFKPGKDPSKPKEPVLAVEDVLEQARKRAERYRGQGAAQSRWEAMNSPQPPDGCLRGEPRGEKTSGGIVLPGDTGAGGVRPMGLCRSAGKQYAAAGTGLTGFTNQTFSTVEPLVYLPDQEVTITLRLVVAEPAQTVRPLKPPIQIVRPGE